MKSIRRILVTIINNEEYSIMVGSNSNMSRDPSGSSASDSNHKIGNIISGTFLRRLIPSAGLRRMFSCSLMLTFPGMEDTGSSQRTELCFSGLGWRPDWNCVR